MTQILAEGFAIYGQGNVVTLGSTAPVGAAMLSGVYAELPSSQTNAFPPMIGQLPWDLTNPDLFYSRSMRGATASDPVYPTGATLRRVLPAAEATLFVSFYFACSYLSPASEIIMGFQDNVNASIAHLGVNSSGQLYLLSPNLGTTYAITSGPVIVATTATHIELKIAPAAGTFEVRVNGTVVINATGITYSLVASIAQWRC